MTSKEALKKLINYLDLSLDRQDEEQVTELLNTIKKDLDRLEKLEKVIEILKGRICIHNGYVCYDAYADVKLTDNECKLSKEVLENE